MYMKKYEDVIINGERVVPQMNTEIIRRFMPEKQFAELWENYKANKTETMAQMAQHFNLSAGKIEASLKKVAVWAYMNS